MRNQKNNINEEIKESNDTLRKYKFEKGYKPKHPILFDYYYMDDNQKEEFIKTYINPDMYWAEKNKEWDYVIEEPIWEVYQFPLVTKEFCNMIIEEVNNFDEFQDNNLGPDGKESVIYDDVGMSSIPGIRNYKDNPLQELLFDIHIRYFRPILKHVWKYDINSTDGSSSENLSPSWTVRYKVGKTEFLNPHHDDATCAFILSLNDNYEGSGTWFERQKTTIHGKTGWCTLHPSRLTHRHGSKRIKKGTRYIMVTFID